MCDIPEMSHFCTAFQQEKATPFYCTTSSRSTLDSLVVAFFHCVCDTESFAHPCVFFGFDAASGCIGCHQSTSLPEAK